MNLPVPTIPAAVLHPALAQLLRVQGAAKLGRMARGFSTPRRFALSCLGLVLAAVWLGNAAAGVLMREPYSPGTLLRLVPLVLMAYAFWHVLKVVYRRPDEAHEWSDAEREFVCGGPFLRHELLSYRFATIGTSAVLKAGFFTLLMLPDLQIPVAGFVGALCALLFLDLLRMCIETAAWGVSRGTYQKWRVAALVITATAVGSATVIGMAAASGGTTRGEAGFAGLLQRAADVVGHLRQTWVGSICEAPFRVFAEVMTASQFSATLVAWSILAVGMVVAMAWLARRSYGYFMDLVVRREQEEFDGAGRATSETPEAYAVARRLPAVASCAGIGPLAWRQAIGAYQFSGSLLISLAIPGVLASLPLVVYRDATMAMLNVVSSLAFYTFVLLPTSVKFDFRRDIDRIAVLKSLPIRPVAVVLGQLATPVLLVTLFQLIVLLIAVLVHPVGPGLLASSLVLLVLGNLLIFALDNLIFLLYPYRVGQEGIDMFLRTTLTFTGKGLLFACGLALVYAWFLGAAAVAPRVAYWSGLLVDVKILFVGGVFVLLAAAAAIATYLLVLAYQRFDPSCDTPA